MHPRFEKFFDIGKRILCPVQSDYRDLFARLQTSEFKSTTWGSKGKKSELMFHFQSNDGKAFSLTERQFEKVTAHATGNNLEAGDTIRQASAARFAAIVTASAEASLLATEITHATDRKVFILYP